MIFSGFKKYHFLFILAALCMLVAGSCKKSDPEPYSTTGEPVFRLTGEYDSATLNLIAGVDSYYMFSAYKYDTANQVFQFSGTMKKAKCTTCKQSVEIIIIDTFNNNGTTSVDIGPALQKNAREYYFPNIIKTIRMDFIAHDSGFSAPTYKWDFGNGQIVNTKIATGIFTDTVSRNVCLTVKDALKTKTSCNFVKPLEVGLNDSCRPNFTFAVDSQQKNVVFYNTSYAKNGYFNWSFGDGKDSLNVPGFQTPVHHYNTGNTYNVCLSHKLPACPRPICKSVVVSDPVFESLADFVYNNPVNKLDTAPKFSKIIIHYIDEFGDEFFSDLKQQPTGSFFNLVAFSPYKNNEKGQKTQKLNISFRCNAFSKTSSNFRVLDITNGVIAIAYP